MCESSSVAVGGFYCLTFGYSFFVCFSIVCADLRSSQNTQTHTLSGPFTHACFWSNDGKRVEDSFEFAFYRFEIEISVLDLRFCGFYLSHVKKAFDEISIQFWPSSVHVWARFSFNKKKLKKNSRIICSGGDSEQQLIEWISIFYAIYVSHIVRPPKTPSKVRFRSAHSRACHHKEHFHSICLAISLSAQVDPIPQAVTMPQSH